VEDVATPEPQLTVEHVDVDAHGGLAEQFGGRVDVDVSFTVRNSGSVTVQPRAQVRISSQIGGGARSPTENLGPLAPGKSVIVHRRIDDVLPFGSVDAIVTVRSEAKTVTTSASTPVVPWLLLTVVLVVVIMGAWALTRRRRKARRPR
jgi:cobalamin biosynthesis Mg chelatase CobN